MLAGLQAGLPAQYVRESLRFEVTQRLAVELQGAELSLLFHRPSPSVALGAGSVSSLACLEARLSSPLVVSVKFG
jgi:hypothetical protein